MELRWSIIREQLIQSCLQMALSFHHILAVSLLHGPGGGGGPFMAYIGGPSLAGLPRPHGRNSNQKTVNRRKEAKKKSVNVRKEFPETWLWTEEMVK